jgi:hypothetical protein
MCCKFRGICYLHTSYRDSESLSLQGDSMKFFVRIVILLSIVANRALAQGACGPNWIPEFGALGAADVVLSSVAWDPDGPDGPLPRVIVVAGVVGAVGTTPIGSVAAWNPADNTWTDMGAPPSRVVQLFITPTNELGVVANFTGTGVYKLTSSGWVRLGGAFNGAVNRVVVPPDGRLVAVGAFTQNDTTPILRTAQWDGSAWSQIGSGVNADVLAATLLSDGTVVIAGEFTNSGIFAISRVARLLPGTTSWAGVTGGLSWAPRALVPLPNGGFMASSSIASQVRQWNGAWISPVVSIFPNQNLFALPNGEYLITASNQARRWDGISATTSGTFSLPGVGSANSVSVIGPDDYFITGGYAVPTTSSATRPTFPVDRMVRVRGGVMERLFSTGGPLGIVRDIVFDNNGHVIVGGEFIYAGEVPVFYVARWDGTRWHAMDGGLNGEVRGLEKLPNGDIIAIGSFTGRAGGPVNLPNIARWNGSTWSSLGVNPGVGTPADVQLLPDGRLAICGSATRVAIWDGTQWTLTPALSPGFDGIRNLGIDRDGNVLAGRMQSGLYRLVNGAWQSMTLPGLPGVAFAVYSLHLLADGDILVGGDFPVSLTESNVYRVSGTAWTPVGRLRAIVPYRLAQGPDGTIIASGAGATNSESVFRWDGSTWTALGIRSWTKAMAMRPNGEFYIGTLTPIERTDFYARHLLRGSFPATCPCDSIDFNRNGTFPELQDTLDFFTVFAGGACSTQVCGDIDFNNNGVYPEDADIVAFLGVLAGDACP